MIPTRIRPGSRRTVRSGPSVARVDERTKLLVQRLQPGDIAVIQHEDLDRVSAEGLVAAGAGGVVNAAPSISGRYPNLGPEILLAAGVPLLDGCGPLLMRKVRDGSSVRIEGDRLMGDGRVLAVGNRQDDASVKAAMLEAGERLEDRFDGFARNTLSFLENERDLLFGGVGMPELNHEMRGRSVLVVVRGYGYREDLAALRPYIRETKPVLIGVDGGADALIEEGYRPDVILGDMDSVSDEALRLATGRTELVLHAYADGRAPGRQRLESMGLPFAVLAATGTSEDVAFLLAHEKGADAIVSVGSHGNLREFLDKGREGMASTFLVRLRVGEILMDAKGVSRVYGPRVRRGDSLLLIGAALFAMVAVVVVSPPLRLWALQVADDLRQLLFRLGGIG